MVEAARERWAENPSGVGNRKLMQLVGLPGIVNRYRRRGDDRR
jgi:hypothetical protein